MRTRDFRLDNDHVPAKNTANSHANRFPACHGCRSQNPEYMTPIHPAQPREMKTDTTQCKHPRVRIVAREEDTEFVECLECGEVFESSEFKDMDIEETKLKEM